MSVLKVGDKLEVMAANVNNAMEPIGTILTVTAPDGHDTYVPDMFQTNAPFFGDTNHWYFKLKHINNGGLKLISTAPAITNIGVTINSISSGHTITLPTVSLNQAPIYISTIRSGGEKTETYEQTKTQGCECGAWSVKDSGHSTWCKLFKPMWNNA